MIKFKLLNTKATAQALGISRSTLYRWYKTNCQVSFPKPYALGRHLRWRSDELDNWIKAQRI